MVAEERLSILVVDDIEANIDILLAILGEKYDVMVAMNGTKAIELAMKEKPDLILLDVMMPGVDGYDVCKTLKSECRTAGIPVIFITSKDDVEDEAHGLSLGAVDYITKPISPPIVRARVAAHIELSQQHRLCRMRVERQIKEIRRGQKDAIYMLGLAGHYKDDDTGVHIWRMANYAKLLSKAAGWSIGLQNMMLLAAPMHDTGKIGIDDKVLRKPAKLTNDERAAMQKHTLYGNRILSVAKSPIFKMASQVALYHHERWTGGGYPERIEGEQIPEAARIVAIADVFDALTMQRPYKKAWPIERALEYISNSKGHFEPRLADLFVEMEPKLVEIKEHWGKREYNATM